MRIIQDMAGIERALRAHDGCNVHGWVDVQRVAGNLHFSVRPEAFFMLPQVQGQPAIWWYLLLKVTHMLCARRRIGGAQPHRASLATAVLECSVLSTSRDLVRRALMRSWATCWMCWRGDGRSGILGRTTRRTPP